MNRQHTCTLSEHEQEERLAGYVATCLGEGADAAAAEALGRQIGRCPACAAEAADVLALLCWREAEVPFNRQALPAPDLPALIGSRMDGGCHGPTF